MACWGERLEQPQLGVPRHDGDGLEQCPRSWTQPCRAGEHGIADGEWDLLFAGRQRLGHEERIACGLAIQLLGVDAVRRSQLRHGRLRKWLELQPNDRAGGAELTEHDAQRV